MPACDRQTDGQTDGPTSCHELLTVNELLVESSRVMFKKIKSPTHCLHMLLPPNKKLDYNLRNSDTYVLPQCTSSTYKHSFVNWCLFDFQ